MNKTTIRKISKGYEEIINTLQKDMGYTSEEDLDNMRESAIRSAKGFLEIVKPVREIKKEVNIILKKSFESSYGGMIVSQNNMVFSFCPHHFLPVAYRITLAYIPDENGRVLGISKLPRICVLLAGRPVLQETLTMDIADIFSINNASEPSFNGIQSKGSAVSVEGLHMCMAMRGVKQPSSRMITNELRGCFFESKIKSEFMSIVTSNRPDTII